MKKNVTYVAREKFDAIIAQLGLRTQDNAGFTKVFLPNGYHAYVPTTKSVGRIDLQWVPDTAGIDELGPRKFGRIVAQLDMGRCEAEILEAFEASLKHGMGLDTYVKPKRSPVKPLKADSSPAEDVASSTDEEIEARKAEIKARHKALVEKVAREKGVPVSDKASL